MSVLLHISDTHFGAEVPEVVEALIRFAHELRPDLLVLSGDVTQRARPAQFAAAHAFVQRLQAPRLLVIPGNHDLPLFNLAARSVDPYAGFKHIFGKELEPSHSSDDLLVLGVKTTRRYRHVDGEISEDQLQRVAQRLGQATPTQLRVVVLHQPVAVPRPTEQKNVVHGHEAAVNNWAAAGADVLLAGHIHLPFVLPLHEARDLPRALWAVNAGTAVSSRVRYDAGNSVNVIRTAQPAAAGRCSVEHWSYLGPTRAFALSATVQLGGPATEPRSAAKRGAPSLP